MTFFLKVSVVYFHIINYIYSNYNDSFFQFTNLSKGATSYRWDFGDLSFYCEKENPTYRYVTVGGEVDVTLTAISDSGKQNSITKTIQAPEVIDIEIKRHQDCNQNQMFLHT